MGTPAEIISFDDFQKAKSFSPPPLVAEKIASSETHEKIVKGPINMGLHVPQATAHEGTSGETPSKKLKTKKAKATKSHPCAKPSVMPSPGPDGYLVDCDAMSATDLRLAYKGEYTSWRLRKNACKNKGWPWDPAWVDFRDFLRSMGPKSNPADTLDRKDNNLQAYGPGLCRWASKAVQNGNKSDSIKIVIPVTGEVWTPAQLAKLHEVKVNTVYKWIDGHFSPLELLAGKKLPALLHLNTALGDLPEIMTAKAKVPAQKLHLACARPIYDRNSWKPTPKEYEHYLSTGEERDSRFDEKCAEYDAFFEWVTRYNAGLPTSPKPPLGKYFKPAIVALNAKSVKAPAPKYAPPEPDDDDDFDPADCAPPDWEGDEEDC